MLVSLDGFARMPPPKEPQVVGVWQAARVCMCGTRVGVRHASLWYGRRRQERARARALGKPVARVATRRRPRQRTPSPSPLSQKAVASHHPDSGAVDQLIARMSWVRNEKRKTLIKLGAACSTRNGPRHLLPFPAHHMTAKERAMRVPKGTEAVESLRAGMSLRSAVGSIGEPPRNRAHSQLSANTGPRQCVCSDSAAVV